MDEGTFTMPSIPQSAPDAARLRSGNRVLVLALVAVLLVSCSTTGDDAGQPLSVADAVAAGDLESVEALLEAGADPDGGGLALSPLMRAATRDDVAMTELLVRWGADLTATTTNGLTVTHVAASADSPNVLEFLIAEGVDVERRSTNGMNAMNHAAGAGAIDALRVLADAGVDLDVPSDVVTQGHGYPVDVGSTSIAIAARAGHVDAVAALLELGASVDARSDLGQTALSQAVVTGQAPAMVELLLDAGADPTIVVECAQRCGSGSRDIEGWARVAGDPDVVALFEKSAAAAG